MAVSFLSFGMACYGKAGRGEGSIHCGEESPQQSGMAWHGEAGRGLARRGYTHCIPMGCRSVAMQGEARRGAAGRGAANTRHLTGCRSLPGKAWLGEARRGFARLGKHTALQGGQKFAWTGQARHGAARPGEDRPGEARRGRAWQTHSIPAGVLKFAGNTNNERKTQWKTQLKTTWRS